jgi:glycogen(starch) synthase
VRICLVSQQYPPQSARGGIGTLTYTKARLLTMLGHEVHVLSANYEPGAGPDLRSTSEEGVTVHRLQRPSAAVDINGQVTYWLGYAWSVLVHLRALEERYRFDVINFAEYGGEGYFYLLDRTPWSWTPVAVELHCPLLLLAEQVGWPEPGSDLHEIGGRQMEGESIRRADRLLSNSAYIADFVAGNYGIERDSIDVTYSGIDLDVFRPGAAPDPDRPVVLFVGSLSETKGIFTALDAALSLRPRYPGLVFRAVGPAREEMLDELRRRASEARAAEAVEFPGFVADRAALAEHYRAATVLCGPSLHEGGLGNVYLEAMACGCPVVAADNGGTRESVVHGETGYLVPAGDVDATAAALDRVLGDPELRGRLGEQARRRIEGYFGAEHYVQRVLASFERAIERSRERRAALEQAAS